MGGKMTDISNYNHQATMIAIDIAKRSHDVLIQWPNGKTKVMRIANTLEDYARLVEAAGNRYPLVAGFEPTADYHRNIAYWLSEHAVEGSNVMNPPTH